MTTANQNIPGKPKGVITSPPVSCSAQRREITCPHCGEKIVDNGKRDEITQDWIAECVCGWWRSLVLPIAQNGDAP